MGLTGTVEEGLTAAVTQDASYSVLNGWMSLHSADPGSSGANEVTSGTGIYARQTVTFSGGGGEDTNTSDVTFTLAAGQTAAWVGLWDSQTGGTFIGGFPMAGVQQVATGIGGSANIACPAYTFSDSDPVRLFVLPASTSSIPTGLIADTTYYVIGVDGDLLNLASTPLGSPITVSASGGFLICADNSQTAGGSDESITFPAASGFIYQTVS